MAHTSPNSQDTSSLRTLGPCAETLIVVDSVAHVARIAHLRA